MAWAGHSVRPCALGLPRVAFVTGLFGDFLSAGRFFGPGDAAEVVVSRGLAGRLGFGSPELALGAELVLNSSGIRRRDDGFVLQSRQPDPEPTSRQRKRTSPTSRQEYC